MFQPLERWTHPTESEFPRALVGIGWGFIVYAALVFIGACYVFILIEGEALDSDPFDTLVRIATAAGFIFLLPLVLASGGFYADCGPILWHCTGAWIAAPFVIVATALGVIVVVRAFRRRAEAKRWG